MLTLHLYMVFNQEADRNLFLIHGNILVKPKSIIELINLRNIVPLCLNDHTIYIIESSFSELQIKIDVHQFLVTIMGTRSGILAHHHRHNMGLSNGIAIPEDFPNQCSYQYNHDLATP